MGNWRTILRLCKQTCSNTPSCLPQLNAHGKAVQLERRDSSNLVFALATIAGNGDVGNPEEPVVVKPAFSSF